MATSKKFSELPAASSVGNGDLFAIAHEDALAETGYVSQKLTAAQAGQKVNGDTEYPTSLPSFPANGQNPFAALEKLNSDIIDLLPVSTASGSIATFSTSLALPLVACEAEIVAQQAGSGTPSPSNPRAISGFNEVVLTHAGSNVWNEEWEVGSYSVTNGQKNINPNNIRCVNPIPVKPNTSYYYKCGTNSGLLYYDINGNYLSYETGLNKVFTTPANCYYLCFYVTSGYGSTYNNDISINYPSTDHDYHAHTIDTHTIALGQTVYGGSVDAKSGKAYMTVKHFSFSEAQYYGTYGADNANLYYVEIPDYDTERIKTYASSAFPDCILISNMFVKNTSSASGMLNNQIRTNTGAAPQYFYFRADEFADLTALNAFLANTPLQVVAELQTPTEITGLTGVNFTTIAGENNIFADCGDVTVSFKQGIQEYIDAKIAETQALIL